MNWLVYALKDPVTEQIRYVGVTTRSMSLRLSEHIAAKRNTHCSAWIKSLTRKGLRPCPVILETGCGPGWAISERKWIASYRGQGANLTNHTDGGEGTLGWIPTAAWRLLNAARARQIHTGRKRSAESCQRMRTAQFTRLAWEQQNGVVRRHPPRSAETLKRMSDAQKGKKASAETRKKLSEIRLDPESQFQTEEYKETLRRAILARPPEQRAAFAHNQKGKPKSEEHRRRIAEAHQGKPKHTEESKQRLREANLGRVLSEEHRRKIGEGSRAAWAKKKAGGSNTGSPA